MILVQQTEATKLHAHAAELQSARVAALSQRIADFHGAQMQADHAWPVPVHQPWVQDDTTPIDAQGHTTAVTPLTVVMRATSTDVARNAEQEARSRI
mmetsp:Transcript_18683/g.33758  ORF Transcript_18683/g.33758 Transcript_18683/m.33758 type:complete len:97 (+) Transcript_18683:303-593(+)